MKITEAEFTRRVVELYRRGQENGWLGMIGDGVSRWLTSRELMQCESELSWDGEYRSLDVRVPRLARECFLICRHDRVQFGLSEDHSDTGLMMVQLNDQGDQFRILWENHPDDHPPMESCIHFTVHAARNTGPGAVVYHCQPLNCLALAGMSNLKGTYMDQLAKGFAAIWNLLPEGVEMIPWGMPKPIRRGMPMTPEMIQDMGKFMENIGRAIVTHEAVVLRGEGLLCAAPDEASCYMMINAIERSAAIRLAMLSAGSE